MKKIIYILCIIPTFMFGQIQIDSSSTVYFRALQKTTNFIDTIEVIVTLQHLDDFEPSEFVTAKKALMERKGHYIEYNTNTTNNLGYFPGLMKIPDETKVFYNALRTKLILGQGVVGNDLYEKVEVVIPKNKILSIYETNKK